LRLIEATDITATVTDHEAGLVTTLSPRARVIVLPNVHAVPERLPSPPDRRRDLLFIGGFQHPPNTDAVRWFATDVLPLIREQLAVDLIVIGADHPRDLERSCGPHVRFKGWVADTQPVFEAARVFVAPLRYGAGMKGKVGQA